MAGFLDVGRVAICHSARGHPARGVRHPACPGPTCPWPTCPSGATPCPCPTCSWPPCPSGATLSGADLHMATCPWAAAKRWSHWGETGLANAGVSLSKMDAPKVGKPVFCSSAVFYHNFRASHSPTVFI